MPSLLDLKQFDFQLHSVRCCRAEVGFYSKRPRSHYEIVYKFDGYSHQNFDNMVIDLIPDSIYIIPRFQSNSYNVTVPGSVVIIAFDIFHDDSYTSLQPELIQLEPDNRYKNQFIRAAKAWDNKSPASYFRAHSIVSTIFADLIADREKQYFQSSKYNRIFPALEYIRQNFCSPITMAMLTELCGISDEYLRILFRSYIGQTPLEYIHTLRLTRARELLADGQISVASAASECGFDNVNYFSRLYKRRYNVPPSRTYTIQFKDPYKENER